MRMPSICLDQSSVTVPGEAGQRHVRGRDRQEAALEGEQSEASCAAEASASPAPITEPASSGHHRGGTKHQSIMSAQSINIHVNLNGLRARLVAIVTKDDASRCGRSCRTLTN